MNEDSPFHVVTIGRGQPKDDDDQSKDDDMDGTDDMDEEGGRKLRSNPTKYSQAFPGKDDTDSAFPNDYGNDMDFACLSGWRGRTT